MQIFVSVPLSVGLFLMLPPQRICKTCVRFAMTSCSNKRTTNHRNKKRCQKRHVSDVFESEYICRNMDFCPEPKTPNISLTTRKMPIPLKKRDLRVAYTEHRQTVVYAGTASAVWHDPDLKLRALTAKDEMHSTTRSLQHTCSKPQCTLGHVTLAGEGRRTDTNTNVINTARGGITQLCVSDAVEA